MGRVSIARKDACGSEYHRGELKRFIITHCVQYIIAGKRSVRLN